MAAIVVAGGGCRASFFLIVSSQSDCLSCSSTTSLESTSLPIETILDKIYGVDARSNMDGYKEKKGTSVITCKVKLLSLTLQDVILES